MRRPPPTRDRVLPPRSASAPPDRGPGTPAPLLTERRRTDQGNSFLRHGFRRDASTLPGAPGRTRAPLAAHTPRSDAPSGNAPRPLRGRRRDGKRIAPVPRGCRTIPTQRGHPGTTSCGTAVPGCLDGGQPGAAVPHGCRNSEVVPGRLQGMGPSDGAGVPGVVPTPAPGDEAWGHATPGGAVRSWGRDDPRHPASRTAPRIGAPCTAPLLVPTLRVGILPDRSAVVIRSGTPRGTGPRYPGIPKGGHRPPIA